MSSKQAHGMTVSQSSPSPVVEPPFAESDSPFPLIVPATSSPSPAPATPGHPSVTQTTNASPRSPPSTPPAATHSASISAGQQHVAQTLSALPTAYIPPAAYHHYEGHGLGALKPVTDLHTFVEYDLSLVRLNSIHPHLWMAGLPMCARPLHYQRYIGRMIILTERLDQHLVWLDDRLFLKPMPRYLMDYAAFKKAVPQESVVNARGLILSYMWLVCSETDLLMAQELRLLPEEITWEGWVRFSTAILSNISPESPKDINPRFLYGELRLTRLNLIYRFCSRTVAWSVFVRGYNYGYHQYSTFVQRNFAWFLTVVVYITLVLTAMQVGFATDELKNNAIFSRASYGFTVFAILAPLGLGGTIAIVVAVVFLSNLVFTRDRRSKARAKNKDLLDAWYADNKLHFNEKPKAASSLA